MQIAPLPPPPPFPPEEEEEGNSQRGEAPDVTKKKKNINIFYVGRWRKLHFSRRERRGGGRVRGPLRKEEEGHRWAYTCGGGRDSGSEKDDAKKEEERREERGRTIV